MLEIWAPPYSRTAKGTKLHEHVQEIILAPSRKLALFATTKIKPSLCKLHHTAKSYREGIGKYRQ